MMIRTRLFKQMAFFSRNFKNIVILNNRCRCFKSSQSLELKFNLVNNFLYDKLIPTYGYRFINVASSLQTKITNIEKSDSKKEDVPDILNDEEFQNILNDFAKDFGIGDDINILGDLKNKIDESKKNTSLSNDDLIQENEHFYHIDEEINKNNYTDLNKRGTSGVFDIEELIPVLKKENLFDISVISIPKSLHYVDYMVLSTAKSPRHAKAVSELIVKLYKKKKDVNDPFIIIEGEDVSNWKAIDMGNIVIHLFLEETRNIYDIESLWLLDPIYDSGGNVNTDPNIEILEDQIAFFHSLNQTHSNKYDEFNTLHSNQD